MFDPQQLAALAAVHRRGAFHLAASDLGVTQSAVSQRIKALEDQVGAVLLLRGSPCQATEAGMRLVRHFDTVALLENEVRREFAQVPASSTLRIAVNADSLATWFLPALVGDGFLFDITIDDEDASQEWLLRGEVAGVVTAHKRPLQGCETVALGALRYLPTASPAYLARWLPDGVTAQALTRAPALRFSDKDRLQDRWAEAHLGQPVTLPTHRLGSTQGFVEACRLGIGWALNPEVLVRDDLARGDLVLLADRPFDVPLYWQFNRLTAQAIAPLTRTIRNAARVLVQPD